jgi:hypothetical protein
MGDGKDDVRVVRTPEEQRARAAAITRKMDLMARGLSGCCEAPLDESRVIATGRYKGHGPRCCSKCGKVVFVA